MALCCRAAPSPRSSRRARSKAEPLASTPRAKSWDGFPIPWGRTAFCWRTAHLTKIDAPGATAGNNQRLRHQRDRSDCGIVARCDRVARFSARSRQLHHDRRSRRGRGYYQRLWNQRGGTDRRGFADANGVVHGFVASPRAGVGGDRADTSASPRKHWVSERKDRWVTERAQLATDGRTRAEVTGATVSRR